MLIRAHEDPVLFREAVNFTAAQTRFLPRLIEKDYFCTVLLNYMAATDDAWVFKGGTCLAKVHGEFYRLSEDLDFVIPTPVFNGIARTLLLDPISGRPMTPTVPLPCISQREAMAEKLRAALSRREVAIRDFYDIDYAIRRLDLHPLEPALIELVRQKLAVLGNDPVDMSEARLAALRQQLDAQLKPVLRKKDFAEFDLESAFRLVADVAASLGI